MKYKFLLSIVAVLAFSLAACAPSTDDTPTVVATSPSEFATDTPAAVQDTPTTAAMATDTEMAATMAPSSGGTEVPPYDCLLPGTRHARSVVRSPRSDRRDRRLPGEHGQHIRHRQIGHRGAGLHRGAAEMR